MIVVSAELIEQLNFGKIHQAKMVFNHRGAIIIPVSKQHRDAKVEGISYEDNYVGNALAAMLRSDAIEIRFHQSFGDAAVANIVRKLVALPELSKFALARVTYQGRELTL